MPCHLILCLTPADLPFCRKKPCNKQAEFEEKSYIDLRDANKVTDRINIYELDELNVGGAHFSDVGFARIGFTESGFFSCMGIDGTLGPNILKEGVWHFDYPNKKIIFTDQLSPIPGIDQAIRVPISTNNIYKPWIEFTVNGVTRKAIVDSVANSLFLIPGKDATTWQGLFPFVEKQAAKSSAGNSAMVTQAAVLRVDTIQFGDLQLTPVFAETGQFLQDYILGNRIIEYYNLTFNLAENALYFHPYKAQELKKEITSFGFSFDFENGQIIIGSMFAGGPAQKAGIQSGDIVSKINGQSYAFANYCDFLNNFELEKLSTLTLEIERDGKLLTFELKKAKIL